MNNNIDKVECIEYFSNFLPDIFSKTVYNDIMKEVNFLSDDDASIIIMGKKVKIPRRQCAYGNKNLSYKFSGIKINGEDWGNVPTLNNIKKIIHEKLKIPVNFVLVNLYRDGNDYIGYHSDDEKDLDNKYPIVSLSFGEKRIFLLKNKITGKIYEKILENNSCILMKHPCQSLYKHSIPKRKKINKPRINLTFRVIK